VCLPKSTQCDFSDDECNVFSPTVRPELRCAIVECVEGLCADVKACIQDLRVRFNFCSG
jgi:hypothetical protein